MSCFLFKIINRDFPIWINKICRIVVLAFSKLLKLVFYIFYTFCRLCRFKLGKTGLSKGLKTFKGSRLFIQSVNYFVK